ncbi:MAG: hypothetical protein C0518_10770 [Opitutus sp.]|nr:hypothetical protein [Opitutus sp.]
MKSFLAVCCLALLTGCASSDPSQVLSARAEDHERSAIEARTMELSKAGFSYRDARARAESEYSGSMAPLRKSESGRRVFAGTPVN